MANAEIMQEESTVSREFSKFKIVISILLITFGSVLAILYFAEFYAIYLKNNPAGIFERTEKNRWIYQTPVRYSVYCLAAGGALLIPLFLTTLAMAKKREDYYKMAIGMMVLFSIVRRFIE